MSRAGTAESVLLLAAFKQDDRWKAPDEIMPGQFHVFAFIHFQFGEFYPAFERFHDPADHGCYGDARATPVCPEIHQNRSVLRGLNDLLLEIVKIDFKDMWVM